MNAHLIARVLLHRSATIVFMQRHVVADVLAHSATSRVHFPSRADMDTPYLGQ
jgi:hypothetical protein